MAEWQCDGFENHCPSGLRGSNPLPSAAVARVVLKKDEQKRFIREVKVATKMSWRELSEIIGVSARTLRDWQKERYLVNYNALLKLSEFSNVSLPEILEKRSEYWSVHKAGRKGAYARMEIYGNPGTAEGRRKGGLISQQRRRENPEKYRAIGCLLRKVVNYPPHSQKLAEAFGILLGDGGINSSQVSISLNAVDDSEYATFVKNLFESLFKIEVTSRKYKNRRNTLILVISGVNLVEFLVKQGLKVGNKVRHQIAIPGWIMKNQLYRRACARGLMDTDGCVFDEKHHYKGKVYSYKALTFTNYSYPLMKQYIRILQNLKIKTIINSRKRISIRRNEQIERYVRFIGSNNPKHLKKLSDFGGVPER